MNDAVNHPAHYTDGKIEVIDFIEDKKLPYHLGNAIKYICRAGKKDPDKTIEDLQKAAWYINRYIEKLEKKGSQSQETKAGDGHFYMVEPFKAKEGFVADCPHVCANCKRWVHDEEETEQGFCWYHQMFTIAGSTCVQEKLCPV